MIKKTFRHGTPLSAEVQKELREAIGLHGEYKVAEMVGVGYSSIARGAAGMGLRRGTAMAIKLRLEQLRITK